jgi:hypothetical protein
VARPRRRRIERADRTAWEPRARRATANQRDDRDGRRGEDRTNGGEDAKAHLDEDAHPGVLVQVHERTAVVHREQGRKCEYGGDHGQVAPLSTQPPTDPDRGHPAHASKHRDDAVAA